MKDWINSLFKSIDKMDAAGFASFLTEGASFRFGNAPAVTGRANIENAVANFFSTIKSLNHHILGIWEEDDAVICEGEVIYVRHDDKQLTLPFTDIFRMKDGLIADYRIYMDSSALYS